MSPTRKGVAWSRPPGGEAVRLGELNEIVRSKQPVGLLRRRLAAWLATPSDDQVELRRSGRDALRTRFEAWKHQSGRNEIIVPAYTCYSVPAAVVAAGMRVRLVDVDLEGRIDLESLSKTEIEGAAGIVVCNLFGWAEALEPIEALVSKAGVPVLDDAAQSLGARDAGGRFVGRRGVDTVLSFGRGKPLQGLGGGAVLLASDKDSEEDGDALPVGGAERVDSPAAQNAASPSTALKALLRSAVWDASLTRPVFSVLSRIPALGIGRTEFDPGFASGPIDPGNAAIAAAQLPAFEERARARRARTRRLADAISATTAFVPLVDPRPEEGVYSRFALRAPDAAARQKALSGLARLGAGASALYPESLVNVPALEAHLADPSANDATDFPQSRSLAARILTLPTNRDLSDDEVDDIVHCLASIPAG